DLPLERKKYIIKKSQCKLILSRESVDTEILGINSLNILDAINYNNTSKVILSSCDPEDIAYIIFTSGTTGQPKGVMVKQLGMANHIQAKVNDLSIDKNSKIAQTAPQSFDISIWQFLSALTVGGETVIIEKQILQYPSALVEKLNKEQVTIIQFVPSLFNTFINSIKSLDIKLESLKIVATVGEPLLPTTCRNWFNLYKHIPILNHYGPTECSDGVTHYLISSMNDIPDTVTPIGKPISGLNLYICEVEVNNNKIIQIKESYKTGELYVSGLGVSAGYINDQDKTNSVFLNNPFSDDINHRTIYKTGDLVRYNQDQQLECLGRIDRQVKVRGHRIELAEIENKLIQISQVKECAVIIKKEHKIKITARDMQENDDVDITNLVAYIVCEQTVTRKLLVDELKTYLPDYMIPDYFIVSDCIPHNSNGKIDYNNLKNLEKIRPLTDHPFVLPYTEIQTKLCELYADLVNISPISIRDMFIELGGDSLRAMLAVNHISKQFSINLKISDIYSNNIEQLECLIKQNKFSYKELKPYSQKTDYPLTEIQKQLWFLWKLNPELNNYVLQVEISCDRDFSVDLFNKTWTNAVINFDTLRIKFKEKDGLPFFSIQDDFFYDVKEINLDDSTYIDEDDYRKSVLSKGINLIEDDLFELVILKKGNNRKILLTTHEIVMDAWSLSVILKYITSYYSFLLGKSEKPDISKIGFKDFALWESHNRKPEQLISEESFWKQQLSGEIETIKIPCDSANLLQNTHSNDYVNIKLPSEYVKKINTLSKDYNLTTYSMILSTFYILLNQFSNTDDLIIGSPHVVRDVPGTENLIGFFLNMLPMRFNLKDKEKSFIDICKDVNDIASRAMSNSSYPFSSMVNLLEIERNEISHPIFQIMFNMYSEKSENLNDIINFYAREKDNGFAKYDLVLYCQENEGAIYLQFSYSKDIFDEHLINRLAKQLQHIIKTCIFNEKINIDQLSLVSDSEKSIIIGKADDYDGEYDSYNIYEAFLAVCREHNDKIAYYSATKEYSYAELLDLVETYSNIMSNY
ncbi:condensation domain-containing protein, partial [Gilliamella sp. Fer4-1]|uniref:condensation domain-containing protein n=1 Tax=Gilliamella sp. Fer4-1 TaxID=3120242 RepID=UPI000ADB9A6A